MQRQAHLTGSPGCFLFLRLLLLLLHIPIPPGQSLIPALIGQATCWGHFPRCYSTATHGTESTWRPYLHGSKPGSCLVAVSHFLFAGCNRNSQKRPSLLIHPRGSLGTPHPYFGHCLPSVPFSRPDAIGIDIALSWVARERKTDNTEFKQFLFWCCPG